MGKIKYKKVMFVCTGNYYRSRLAEVLFNFYASQSDSLWEAESRGLTEKTRFSGLSPNAVRYLDKLKIEGPEQYAREPMPLRVEDMEKFDLIVGMNKSEHEPMMRMRFGQMARILEQKGKIRYFNVYDVPAMRGWINRMFGSKFNHGEQPPESSGEHIDFAVQALLNELNCNSAENPAE